MKSITHCILAHGENQVFELITYLRKYIGKEDRIIILNDSNPSNCSCNTTRYELALKKMQIRIINHLLNKDYSSHRNYILEKCNTEYIWMHDADEIPHTALLNSIKETLDKENPDAVWMSRVNLFEGIKPIHALMYGWTLQDNICNFPDPQCRLIKLRKGIRWVGKLHERPRLEKYHKVIQLPFDQEHSIIHRKTIETQLAQNERYNKEFSLEENSGEQTQQLLKE